VRTAGLAILLGGGTFVVLGYVAIWSYGKRLGELPYRIFVGEVKLGVVALALGGILLAISVVT
jgi:hypothetical protein